MTRIVGDRRDRLRAMLADLKMPGALGGGGILRPTAAQ